MTQESDKFKPNDKEALRVFSKSEKTEFQPLIENVFLGVFFQENLVGKVGSELKPEAYCISEDFGVWKNKTAESFYNRNSKLGVIAGDTIRGLTLEKAHQYALYKLSKYRQELMTVRSNLNINGFSTNYSEESELQSKAKTWHYYSRVINYAKIKAENRPPRAFYLTSEYSV